MNVLLKHRNHLGYVSIKAYQIAKVKQKKPLFCLKAVLTKILNLFFIRFFQILCDFRMS